jgi:hypothetical protein
LHIFIDQPWAWGSQLAVNNKGMDMGMGFFSLEAIQNSHQERFWYAFCWVGSGGECGNQINQQVHWGTKE